MIKDLRMMEQKKKLWQRLPYKSKGTILYFGFSNPYDSWKTALIFVVKQFRVFVKTACKQPGFLY